MVIGLIAVLVVVAGLTLAERHQSPLAHRINDRVRRASWGWIVAAYLLGIILSGKWGF